MYFQTVFSKSNSTYQIAYIYQTVKCSIYSWAGASPALLAVEVTVEMEGWISGRTG